MTSFIVCWLWQTFTQWRFWKSKVTVISQRSSRTSPCSRSLNHRRKSCTDTEDQIRRERERKINVNWQQQLIRLIITHEAFLRAHNLYIFRHTCIYINICIYTVCLYMRIYVYRTYIYTYTYMCIYTDLSFHVLGILTLGRWCKCELFVPPGPVLWWTGHLCSLCRTTRPLRDQPPTAVFHAAATLPPGRRSQPRGRLICNCSL